MTDRQPWEIAKTLLGVKFEHMGRSVHGMDCVGVIVHVANTLGLTVRDSPHYGREPARNNNAFQLAEYLERNFGPPVKRPYGVNDVVMMKLRPRFDPAHVGIIAPHRYGLALIHAYGEVGKVVYHRVDETWHSRIIQAYQWPPAT